MYYSSEKYIHKRSGTLLSKQAVYHKCNTSRCVIYPIDFSHRRCSRRICTTEKNHFDRKQLSIKSKARIAPSFIFAPFELVNKHIPAKKFIGQTNSALAAHYGRVCSNKTVNPFYSRFVYTIFSEILRTKLNCCCCLVIARRTLSVTFDVFTLRDASSVAIIAHYS